MQNKMTEMQKENRREWRTEGEMQDRERGQTREGIGTMMFRPEGHAIGEAPDTGVVLLVEE